MASATSYTYQAYSESGGLNRTFLRDGIQQEIHRTLGAGRRRAAHAEVILTAYTTTRASVPITAAAVRTGQTHDSTDPRHSTAGNIFAMLYHPMEEIITIVEVPQLNRTAACSPHTR